MKKVDMFYEVQLYAESINGAMSKAHLAFREVWVPDSIDKIKYDDVEVAHRWIYKIMQNEFKIVHDLHRLESDEYWERLYRLGEHHHREMQLLATAYITLRKAMKNRPALLNKTKCAKLERS